MEIQKIYETTPEIYALNTFFQNILRAENNSIDEKTETLVSNLSLLPLYYKTVKQNLSAPSQDKLEIALEKEKAFYQMLHEDVPKIYQVSQIPFEKKDKDRFLLEAKIAVKDYIAYLNSLQFEQRNSALKTISKHPDNPELIKGQKND